MNEPEISHDEFCLKVSAVKVLQTKPILVGKKGRVRVDYVLGFLGTTPGLQRTVWSDGLDQKAFRETVKKDILSLVCGKTSIKMHKGGRRSTYLWWKVASIRRRLEIRIEQFKEKGGVREKVKRAEASKNRRVAMDKLVEATKVYLRAVPHATRADMHQALKEAKDFETIRQVMEE